MSSKISSPTIANLIEFVATVYTHTELDTFFMKLDLERYTVQGGSNRQVRVRNIIEMIRTSNTSEEANRLILSIAREFLEKRVGESSYWLEKVEDLLTALRADGWEFSNGKLIPTTSEPASLAPETSMLQRELTKFDFDVAAVHYQQALENFRERRFESSNGQLRSFLESLYIELCKRKTGKTFTDASAVIQHLFQVGALEGGEYNLARGLFESSNERGAHHGLTDSEEALFRFHFSTAFSRYLLARLRN